MVRLMSNDYNELKKMGYTDIEIQDALLQIEKEELGVSNNQVMMQRYNDPRMNSNISSFSTRPEDNLAKWQLELNDLLERAEHILRGDIPVFRMGQIVWEKNPSPEFNTLNETGVNEIMKILAMYVNRNTILSDYTNDEIRFKVYDFGRDVNNLIFMRYEEFGMDTIEKRKQFPMIVREIIDVVHSAYKRALDGAEKRSLREIINISQNTSTGMPGGVTVNNAPMQRERGLLNPNRWIKGKYVI